VPLGSGKYPAKRMQLSIILLNYNSSSLSIKCVNSLYDHFSEKFDDDIFETIIVDNASSADEINFLEKTIKEKKYKNISLIKNKTNTGFSSGCNMGVKNAKGDVILFLNNDTQIMDKGILGMLNFIKENEKVAILGGKLLNSDGSQQPSVGKFYTLWNVLLYLWGLERVGIVNKNPDVISNVDWVKGGCMMVKRDVFKALSGFDENIFMYTEDMEICYRAKKKGYGIYFFPNVKIVHEEQGSSSRSFAIVNIYSNLLYFYKKHKSSFEYKVIKVLLVAKARIAIFVGTITGNNYLKTTYKKAIQF
jgi:GT2 family glycosyltransferase